MACVTCGLKFFDTNELEAHTQETHPFLCVICFIELENKEGLGRHIEDSHTYICDGCGFIAISEDIMENHILEKHARPDFDGNTNVMIANLNHRTKRSMENTLSRFMGPRLTRKQQESTIVPSL